MATYTNVQVPVLLPCIMMSSLQLGMVPLVGNIDSTIWLPDLHDLFLLILVHAHTIFHYVTVHPFPHMLKSSSTHTLSCHFTYYHVGSTKHIILPLLHNMMTRGAYFYAQNIQHTFHTIVIART